MDKQLQENMPIYMQIMQKVREAIASGELAPGARVASVRELAGVFAVKYLVARLHFHLHIGRSGAYGDHFTCEGFFFGCVGDEQSAGRFLFCGIGFDQNPVC